MSQPNGFATDTDVMRGYAGFLEGSTEPARRVLRDIGPGGCTDLSTDALDPHTGWLHLLSDELRAFRASYGDCQLGMDLRLKRIVDCMRDGGRLLREAAADYEASDANAANGLR